MNFLSLIEAKRDGQVLEAGQIKEIISAYVAGKIPDYQMSAMLMVIYFRGLTTQETSGLTLAMRDSFGFGGHNASIAAKKFFWVIYFPRRNIWARVFA